MTQKAICETTLPGRGPDKRGKVRDIYDLGDRLLIVNGPHQRLRLG